MSCRPLLTTASAVANPVFPVQPFTITGGFGAAMATGVCAMADRARRKHAPGRTVLRRAPANEPVPSVGWVWLASIPRLAKWLVLVGGNRQIRAASALRKRMESRDYIVTNAVSVGRWRAAPARGSVRGSEEGG